MAGFSGDQMVAFVNGRERSYVVIAAYNVAGIIGNLALILAFGPGLVVPAKLAIAVSVIAVAVISILPAQSIFQEIEAVRGDVLPEMQGSHVQANFDAMPLALFNKLTIGFNAVIAVVQIWALFSV